MKHAVYSLLLALTAALAQADLLARFRTGAGDIVVQLYEHEKPITVANFVKLAEAGAYQNCFFHRCVPGFIVQGGGFSTVNPASTNLFLSYVPTPNFGAITNEYSIGAHYSNVYGTIAMAKVAGNPDSATSQWFFNLADNSENLDSQNGGFTVFGRVVSGFNVLQAFNTLSMSNGIVDLTQFYGAGASAFSDLPVRYPGHYAPHYNELIYVGIQLLHTTEITQTGNAFRITWESAAGLTNHLEASNALLEGSWTNVLTTSGTGANITVTLTNPPSTSLYYRIRVEVPPE